MRELEEHNAKLMQRAASVETKHAGMMEQVAQINACLQAKSEENERLQAELEQLRQSLLVGFKFFIFYAFLLSILLSGYFGVLFATWPNLLTCRQPRG